MRRISGLTLVAGLLVTPAVPAQGQASIAWQNMWFWGAQGGINVFQTRASTATETAFTFGGHWLITGRRSGFYISYDQILYSNAIGTFADATSGTGTRNVQFDNGRYLQADLLAIPVDGAFQILVGAGLLLHQISDPVVQGTFATPADQAFSQSLAEAAASRAFWNIMAGFQLQFGGRFAVFGHYEFIPSARDFLIVTEQHNFVGGLRLALSGRREDIGTQN